MSSVIKVEEVAPGIVTIILNRPEKRNALNVELLEGIDTALDKIHLHDHNRVIILQGAGPVFCAGLDLNELADQTLVDKSTSALFRALHKLYSSPLVTISAMHGAAVAGGAGFVSVCDIAIAARGSVIGYPEVRRGLVGALIMPILQRQVSEHHMKEILLLGELYDAEKAAKMGLLNAVYAPEELASNALRLAKLALKGAPIAIAQTKHMIDQLYPSSTLDNLKKAYAHHLDMRVTHEALEGSKAFLEKRLPSWDISE